MNKRFLFFVCFFFLQFAVFPTAIILADTSTGNSLVDVTFTGDFKWEGPCFWGNYVLENISLFDSQSGAIIDNNEITVANGHDLLIRCPNKNLGNYDSNAYSIVWDHSDCLGDLPSNDSLYVHDIISNYGSDINSSVSENGPYFLLTATKAGSVGFKIYFGYWNRIPPGNGLPPYPFIVQGQLLSHMQVTVVNPSGIGSDAN